jgi:peptidoglycan L-alanyl-D-glutamate endopeptidase CwlK
MSRSLEDLRPQVREMAQTWLTAAKYEGLDPLVTCTLRSNAEQALLYAQGRTVPGLIVTNAKPGQSAHNYGLALDFVPMVNGKPEWSGKHPHWARLGALAEEAGFEWAARWVKFRELPHIQLHNWRDFI